MDAPEFERRLHDAETRLSRLKSLYEQWFQGFERTEPQVARKELDRAIEHLRKEQPRNTALRFRFQQLVSRYGTYGIYWSRVARQIEEGTYARDVRRARARALAARDPEAREGVYEIDVDVDAIEEIDTAFDDTDIDAILGALAPSPSPAPSPAPAPRVAPRPLPPAPAPPPAALAPPPAAPRPVPAPAARPSPGGAPLDLQALYDRYIDARRRNNERTDNVRFETLKKNVEEMLPKLKAKHGGKQIDFDVVLANGKVGLKPKVR